jgi:hypothetical protein
MTVLVIISACERFHNNNKLATARFISFLLVDQAASHGPAIIILVVA